MGRLFLAGLAVVGIMIWIVSQMHFDMPEPPTLAEKITKAERGCDSEFGAGSASASDCKLRLMDELFAKDREDRTDRARRGY